MNNHRTEARASLRELSAAIIRLGVKTEDPELLFLGQSLATVLRASADPTEREALNRLISGHVVRRLMRAAGSDETEILVMEHFQNSVPN